MNTLQELYWMIGIFVGLIIIIEKVGGNNKKK